MSLYYRATGARTIALVILIIIVSLTPFASAYIFKLILDKLVEVIGNANASLEPFIPLLIYSTLIGVTSKVSWSLIEYIEKLNHLDFKKYLDIIVDRKYSHLGFEHYSNPKTNDLLNRVRETFNWRPINFASRQLWIMQNIINAVSNSLAIFALNIWVFIAILISSIPEFIIKMKYGRDVWGIHAAKGSVRRDYWNTSWYVKEEQYLEEIRIFRSGNYFIKRIKELYNSFLDLQKSREKKKLIQTILSNILALTTFTISEIYILISALGSRISIGSLNFYNGRIYSLNENLKSFFKNLGFSYEDLLYVKDLFKVLNLKNKIIDKPNSKIIKKDTKLIEFKNVSFKYPNNNKYVLKDFNLTIKPKQKIALIGENGGGKTTIIRLLCRFYDPQKGQILVNGTDLKDIKLDSWYKCLGVLFQDFNRYSYSVKDNILLGDVDKTYEKKLIQKASKKSQAHSFIMDYDNGYKTILSKKFKKGIEPSVGQWQKIALSRAFFRDAPILILDEPTSAIDAKAEAEIFKHLEKFEKDKTVIMISHRFSTVRNADNIYVIDKGKIIESGSHEKLIKKKGKYEKLFKLQAKGYK